MGRGVSGSECEYVVLEDPDELSRIHPHGGCQTPCFILVFSYAYVSHPFPAPDGDCRKTYHADQGAAVNIGRKFLKERIAYLSNSFF